MAQALFSSEQEVVALKSLSGRPIKEMAYNRETFKDRVEEKLRGAMLEYYKAETAVACGLTKLVEHWRSEARRLLLELEKVVLPHAIRGFRDRKKAFQEVLEYVKQDDDFYRESARRIVARDFSIKKLTQVMPDTARDAFYQAVASVEIPR